VVSFNKGVLKLSLLIQELEHHDHIWYSVGVKLVGSHLDRVDLEKEFNKKTSICFV